MSADLLITGTGSLAEAVLFDLAAMATAGPPMRVVLAGRNVARLTWLAQAANTRAAAHGVPHRVVDRKLDWNSAVELARLLSDTRPALVFHTASLQSMWEIATGRDAWAAMIRASGYGATLPLQLSLALRVARAIDECSPESRLVNACYPDAANEILVQLGHNVVCGIGNVATLAAAYREAMGLSLDQRLRMLAHHRHVSAAITGMTRRYPPRIWVEEHSLENPSALPNVRLPADDSLNRITGATGAVLLAALLGRVERHVGHAPGPNGLPGGYPVVVDTGRLAIDLPADVNVETAVALNRAWGADEGVELDASGVVRIALINESPLPVKWNIKDTESIALRMMAVRAELKGVVSPSLNNRKS